MIKIFILHAFIIYFSLIDNRKKLNVIDNDDVGRKYKFISTRLIEECNSLYLTLKCITNDIIIEKRMIKFHFFSLTVLHGKKNSMYRILIINRKVIVK